MFCTNCGAEVDNNAKFCPVCGNKLDRPIATNKAHKEPSENVINKSTYESVNNNENLIENKEEAKNSESKAGKFSKVFAGFKSKKSKEATIDKNDPNKEAINDNTNFNDKTPVEGLVEKTEYEREMPPSYYGYNPVDERKRKELRHQNTSYRPGPEDFIKRPKNPTSPQESVSPQSESFKEENFLSVEQRIAARLRGDLENSNLSQQSQKPTPSYNDIPEEYLEARIARKIQEQKGINPANTTYPSSIKRPVTNSTASGISDRYQAYDEKPANDRIHQKDEVNATGSEPTNQTPPSPPADKEKKEKEPFKFKPIYLLPIVLILLALAVGFLLKNRKPAEVEIDLTQYMEVSFQGDDGQASPSASIDSSRLLADYANEIAYVNKDRKDSSFGSAANQFVDELEKTTMFQFSKDNNLSNGEEITAVANISDSALLDDYNVLFTNTMKSVIVDGLITTETQDPFQYINVDFEGEDPNISLVTSLREDAPEYMSMVEIAPSKTSELTAGEEVNINLRFDEEEIFNSYGLRLSPVDQTFTVPGEASDEASEENEDSETSDAALEGYISSVDSLDEDSLGTLKYNAGQLIKNTFNQRSFTKIGDINYLGAITGSDSNADSLKNRVMLVYEIKANEDYEGRYTNEYTYYTFVEYQNVKDSKDENGEFYSDGPITTDNEIFHKFFVEDDYTYYEIPYYGFAFLEEVITRINNSLSGLTIDDSIAADVASYFESSDGIAGEYQGNGTRLSLKSDGTLRYQLDQRVHQGTWQDNDGNVTLTIEGVNVDTPINASFENGALNVPEQGEMSGQTFNKMQAMN